MEWMGRKPKTGGGGVFFGEDRGLTADSLVKKRQMARIEGFEG